MKGIITLMIGLCSCMIYAQTFSISGQLMDSEGAPAIFANLALYNSADSLLTKVETTNEEGKFKMNNITSGDYYIEATYVGMNNLTVKNIALSADKELGILNFESSGVDLTEATVTASRVMVEVKPDRTVFNVSGTINSVGSDAIALLRKAPSVVVDNNDNINVLGRSGVLVYVDGKRLPLAGQALSDYLKNIPAEQIDHIDIITSPGAKYEAEGNAGIIDIRLIKDKSHGSNGTVSATYSQGRYPKGNVTASANYRNSKMNIFGSAGGGYRQSFNDMAFEGYQNGLVIDETIKNVFENTTSNFRIGTDFFIDKKQTIGVLVEGNQSKMDDLSVDKIYLSKQITATDIDSVLIANNTEDRNRDRLSYNLNYQYRIPNGKSFNLDLDYGQFKNTSNRFQPNRYYNAAEDSLLTESILNFDTPTDIDIYTIKADYEDKLYEGTFSVGTKLSRVVSDNTFLVFDNINDVSVQNDRRSNLFLYEENVYAAYVNYARSINRQWSFTAGVRAELTDAVGDLSAFLPSLDEPPVELNYLSWFPSLGLTWSKSRTETFNLNYGRRINRPDYNVLNPFNNQISEISFEKGNPFLKPEIVNNIELGYTLNYRYNFKLAYSKTIDQITRLIAPDADDPRAGFISWDNLAEQNITSFNVSAPVQVMPKWSAYFNGSASYIDNQADYGDGAIVDVQAFTYSIYQQHTFDLPWGLKAEIGGYFSGPGVWGGVFKYDESWSLDVGLQKQFLNKQLTIKLSGNDLFYQTGWNGVSEFNGLVSYGQGEWDSRKVGLSISYRFGNNNVKSRKRKVGIEDEADRVGGN